MKSEEEAKQDLSPCSLLDSSLVVSSFPSWDRGLVDSFLSSSRPYFSPKRERKRNLSQEMSFKEDGNKRKKRGGLDQRRERKTLKERRKEKEVVVRKRSRRRVKT